MFVLSVSAAFAIFSAALMVSVVSGVSIMAPLFLGLCLFAGTALKQGHSPGAVAKMTYRGVKKSIPVLVILVLIGILTAMWHAGGTISLCVYYGLSAINPRFFLLSAFILSCCFSYAIGSCFGTAGTIGVVIMALARSGGVDARIAAGVVLSGAFFGDRCAPVSSSANLVAALTETRLYGNIRNMFRTAFVPMLLSLAAYFFLSFGNPMQGDNAAALAELASAFELEPIMLLPAALILLLPILGVDVRKAMLASILAGAFLSVFARGIALPGLLHIAALGYEPTSDGRFARILAGGGILSMTRALGTVFVASAYAGIFEETGMLNGIRDFMERRCRRVTLYIATMAMSVVTIMFACNQTFSVILTSQFMKDIYDHRGVPREVMAIDLEDSVILIAGLVPWSIAVAMPLALMEADAGSIPYAVFLWLVPLVNLFPPMRRHIALTVEIHPALKD